LFRSVEFAHRREFESMGLSRWSVLFVGGFLAAAMAAGCGGGSGRAMPVAGHKGQMTELPGNRGYFEIRAKSAAAPAGRGGASLKAAAVPIVVHFYGPDGSTELSPAPTDVSVRIGGATGQVVPLSAQTGGGFASAPGRYPSGFRGTLSAKIDGEPIEVNFVIR
jgi:hypothetical protein